MRYPERSLARTHREPPCSGGLEAPAAYQDSVPDVYPHRADELAEQAKCLQIRLAEAEDELRVVRHAVGRPGRVERQLDLDLLDPGQ